MSHRHHYQNDFGEPAIAVILIVALGMALAMCRYWCKESKNERRENRRRRFPQNSGQRTSRSRNADIATTHLVLQMPPGIEAMHEPLITQSPTEFTASAPMYSVVMQNPSIFVSARPGNTLCRPPGHPETPPPPYPVTPPLFPKPGFPEPIPEEESLDGSRERNV